MYLNLKNPINQWWKRYFNHDLILKNLSKRTYYIWTTVRLFIWSWREIIKIQNLTSFWWKGPELFPLLNPYAAAMAAVVGSMVTNLLLVPTLLHDLLFLIMKHWWLNKERAKETTLYERLRTSLHFFCSRQFFFLFQSITFDWLQLDGVLNGVAPCTAM